MSNIVSIHRAGSKSYKDYLAKQKAIKAELDSVLWVNTSTEDKYIIIKYFIVGSEFADANAANTAKVGFLMGEGYSLGDAQAYLLDAFAVHHKNEIPACKDRGSSILLNKVVLSYLSEEDATDFTETAGGLFDLYTIHGRKGSNDNSQRDGLFDFIESTSSYTTMGLEQQNYTLLQGTWTEFKAAMMDILRNGNY